MTKKRGRPILGGISGFIFGLFLGVDLFLFGAIESDSVLITVLPVVFAIVGVALGLLAPIPRRRRGDDRDDGDSATGPSDERSRSGSGSGSGADEPEDLEALLQGNLPGTEAPPDEPGRS